MAQLELPDALSRLIEQKVAEGLAESPTALVEKAVACWLDDVTLDSDDLALVVAAGRADLAAGRYAVIATAEDKDALHRRLLDGLQR